MTDQKPDLTAFAVEIAAAYVGYNQVAASDLPELIVSLRAALTALALRRSMAEPDAGGERKLTQGQIRKSITPDVLISFIDGKPYKMLKRHLRLHGLDALGYRQKYDLPHDYPMVAPSYSERRSELAKGRDFGRGSKGRPKKVR